MRKPSIHEEDAGTVSQVLFVSWWPANKASVLFHEGMRKRGGLLVRCRPTIKPIHVWRVFADFSHFLILVDKINPSQDTFIPI
jgi:hypothetical protein